ncbi:MAG TPA: WGxxGxxG family protein [Sphingomicrobium sp.]
MRKRMLVALIFLTAAVGPASAQENDRGSIRTETQDRLVSQDTNDILWNSIGLLGLLGLLGFRRRHGEDSYHPAALE